MHDIIDFYNALWGDSKLYRSIWYGEKGKAPNRSEWFKSTEKAVAYATSLAQIPRYNVYHACSTFTKTSCTQVCAENIFAFWIDLDLKDCKQKTIGELGKSYLPMFADCFLGTGFWVIKTGNGLHIYWIYEKPIERWKERAQLIEDFCKSKDIPVDRTRTKDSASRMRFPGSFNMKKGNPKKVKLVHKGKILDNKILPEVKPDILDNKKTKFKKEDFNLNLAISTTSHVESDANKIADKCGVIEAFRDNGLDISEPLWHQALSIIVRCQDGAELAHEFSSKSPRYNKDETEQKLQRLLSNDIGPCLCDTFQRLDDTFCKKCPHNTKIKSCIQLGAIIKPLKINVDDLATDKQKKRAEKFIRLVPAEGGWDVGEGGIYRYVDDVPVIVSRTPFYIIDKFCENIRDDTVITAVIRALTNIGEITFKLPFKLIADDKKLLAEFNGRGIFPYNKKHFSEYLSTYCQKISHIKPVKAVNSLGWQQDGSFVYGSEGEAVSKKGKLTTHILDTAATSYLSGYVQNGSLETWCEAARVLTEDPSYFAHLFSLLCALGTPLLKDSDISGFILSLQGESGTGKTFSHEFACSSWGNPKDAGLLGKKDTAIGRLGAASCIKNLPLRVDEVTKLPPNVMSGLIYELVNGRGRVRATKDGSCAGTAFKWQTITLFTSNRPLLEHSVLEITEAERYRMLELYVPMPKNIKERTAKIGEIMKDNYGVAGKAIVQFIIKNKKYVDDVLEFYRKRFQELTDESKRFWVSGFAIAFTAAKIAEKIGMFDVDMKAMFQWATSILKEQTTVNQLFIKDSRGFDTSEELIGALYDSLSGHIERITPDEAVLNIPIKDIRARLKYVDDKTDIMYVRAPVLNEFIKRHFNDSVQKIKKDFKINEPTTIRLGKVTARVYKFTMESKQDEAITE